jgi:hypothetical protein
VQQKHMNDKYNLGRVLACLLPILHGSNWAISVGREVGGCGVALHPQHLAIICLHAHTDISFSAMGPLQLAPT